MKGKVTFKQRKHLLNLISMLNGRKAKTHRILVSQSLSDRESSCLVLAAKGMTSEETADLLGVKASTIETYRRNIKEKLACNTMAQAVYEGIVFGYFGTSLKEKCHANI